MNRKFVLTSSRDMDICALITATLVMLKTVQATTEVRCVACEHIGWNETYSFNNVQYIYYLLMTKYNPACAQKNPRDRNTYEQDILHQLQQQQQHRQFFSEHDYRRLYDVREAFCSNQCTYVFGDVTTYFVPFGGSMKLNVHLRYCFDSLTSVRDGCYQRDTTSGFDEIGVKLQQTLEFLGGPEVVKVLRFVGEQCYCSQNFCLPTASASCIMDSIPKLYLILLIYFVIR